MSTKYILENSLVPLVILISSLIILTSSTLVNKTEGNIKLVLEAGCDAGGQVIAKGVCINDDYEPNKAPNQMIEPKMYQGIHVSFLHQEVLNVEEKQKRLKMDVRIGLWWRDDRIMTNSSLLNTTSWIFPIAPGITFAWYEKKSWYNKIWYPQAINFEHVFEFKLKQWPATILHVSSGELMTEHFLNTNSTLIFVYKEYLLDLACDFNFTAFPMDIQFCQFQLTNKYFRDMQLKLFSLLEKHEPERYIKDGFDITLTYVADDGMNDKSISYVGIKLDMRRLIHPYLYQYYVPCIAIVCVSQASFIIPPSSVPGRLGLVATQFLTLTNIFIHSNVRANFN
jgi:hypothetical protein